MQIKYHLWGITVPGMLLSATIFAATISHIVIQSIPVLHTGIVQATVLQAFEIFGIFLLESFSAFFLIPALAYTLNAWIKPLIGVDSTIHYLKVMTAGISGFVGVCATIALSLIEVNDPQILMLGSALG